MPTARWETASRSVSDRSLSVPVLVPRLAGAATLQPRTPPAYTAGGSGRRQLQGLVALVRGGMKK